MIGWRKLEPIYNMDPQTHTRKQVQMHMTAKVIAEKIVAREKTWKFIQGIFCKIHVNA